MDKSDFASNGVSKLRSEAEIQEALTVWLCSKK